MRFADKGKKSLPFLVCQSSKAGLGCKHVPWRYSEFENAILSNLAGLDIAAILKDDSAQRAKEALDAERAKLSMIEKSILKLTAMAEAADDIAAAAHLGPRFAELNAQKRTLQASVQELEARAQTPVLGRKHFEQFRKLRESLDRANDDELFDLRLRISHELKRFVDRIEVFPDGDEPWNYAMHLIGVQPERESRFAAVIFKTGGGRILMGNGRGTLWPGPKTAEGVKNAKLFPGTAIHKKAAPDPQVDLMAVALG